jgi:flagellar biosynthesis chaperone FliJ
LKNKFTQLVKLRKQQVDKVEMKILNINNKIEKARLDNLNFEEEIRQQKKPPSGSFAQLILFSDNIKIMRMELEVKKEELKNLYSERELIREELKKLMLEYEKANYLETEEVKKILKEQKKKEDDEMNEISVLLFNNNKKRNKG